MKANRQTALAYIEKWIEWVDDGLPPAFGLMGMMRPKDDPPPGMWAVIQVECAIRTQQEYNAVYGLYILRLPMRTVAARLDMPLTTFFRWHRRWMMSLAEQIEARPAETVVEAEIQRWRDGGRDAICDMAVNCSAIWDRRVPVQNRKKGRVYVRV